MRRDLERIAASARLDAALDALVLTGGFSRGEGTVRDGRPANDYDVVAVRRRPGASPARAGVLALEADGFHVDWLDVWRPRLRFAGPKMFWLDLRLGGRVLAGDPRVLDELPRREASAVPPSEAYRLLLNRAFGLVRYRGAERADVEMQAAKAVLAVADARLVRAGWYAATLAARLDRFRRLATRDAASAAVLPEVERAAAFKLDPDVAPLDGEAAWSRARALLLEEVSRQADAAPRATALEAAWYASRAGSAGLPRFASAPTRRIRIATLALLADLDSVDSAAERALSAFGPSPRDWGEARALLDRARACTLQ